MDGLHLCYTQCRLPPWFIIKADLYKTEHILWLKPIYSSNPFLFYFQTAASHFLCLLLYFTLLPFTVSFFFLWSLLEDAFSIYSKNTRGWQRNKRRARDGETHKVWGNFFFSFSKPTSIQIKSYYLPLALQHCETEWSTEEASLQQRAHCGLIRTLWAGRPPLPAPGEAPHTTALQGQRGPRLRTVSNVLNGHGGSFLLGCWDAKGIICFQHGGVGRQSQPLTSLLTQRKKNLIAMKVVQRIRGVITKALMAKWSWKMPLWAGAWADESTGATEPICHCEIAISIFFLSSQSFMDPHFLTHHFILPFTTEKVPHE